MGYFVVTGGFVLGEPTLAAVRTPGFGAGIGPWVTAAEADAALITFGQIHSRPTEAAVAGKPRASRGSPRFHVFTRFLRGT